MSFGRRGVLGVLMCVAASTSNAQPARELAGQAVCATPQELVARAASARGLNAQLDCERAPSVSAPSGDPQWALADGWPEGGLVWRAGPTRVLLSLAVPGASPRVVAVPGNLKLSSKAWVALRDVPAGAEIHLQALELREHQWAIGQVADGAAAVAPVGRARVQLRKGQPVLAQQLVEPQRRLQGDTVNVTVRTPGLTLQMPGILVAAASVGQSARVQPQGRQGTLQGVLVDAYTVVVER